MPTLIGLIVAICAVSYMMVSTRLDPFDAFIKPVEITFVFGASLGCGIMRAAFSDTLFMFAGIVKVFVYSSAKPLGLVNEIVELANINRRDGPIAMQNVEIKNAFLKTATDMVVDGVDGRAKHLAPLAQRLGHAGLHAEAAALGFARRGREDLEVLVRLRRGGLEPPPLR